VSTQIDAGFLGLTIQGLGRSARKALDCEQRWMHLCALESSTAWASSSADPTLDQAPTCPCRTTAPERTPGVGLRNPSPDEEHSSRLVRCGCMKARRAGIASLIDFY
jgi:hypothetical protein